MTRFLFTRSTLLVDSNLCHFLLYFPWVYLMLTTSTSGGNNFSLLICTDSTSEECHTPVCAICLTPVNAVPHLRMSRFSLIRYRINYNTLQLILRYNI